MTENQEKKDLSPDQIIAIEKSLSSDRFNSYVIQAKGDRGAAIRLYERNTEVSEALYGVIQGLEITLRNSMHRILHQGVGFENWYDHTHLQDAEADSLRLAKKSRRRSSQACYPSACNSKNQFWILGSFNCQHL
jgi:hypothetical protein